MCYPFALSQAGLHSPVALQSEAPQGGSALCLQGAQSRCRERETGNDPVARPKEDATVNKPHAYNNTHAYIYSCKWMSSLCVCTCTDSLKRLAVRLFDFVFASSLPTQAHSLPTKNPGSTSLVWFCRRSPTTAAAACITASSWWRSRVDCKTPRNFPAQAHHITVS